MPQLARAAQYFLPLFVELQNSHPALHILNIEIGGLYLDNSGGVIQLTLRGAELRPPELRHENVFGARGLKAYARNFNDLSTRKPRRVKRGHLPQNQIDFHIVA